MNKKLDCFMNSLHFLLRTNNIHLTEEQIKDADEEIIKIIIENGVLDEIPERETAFDELLKVSDKFVAPFVFYYYAYTQGNLTLLKKLNHLHYSFHDKMYSYKMFPLDREYSEHFEEDEYIRLLLRNNIVMRNFDASLLNTRGQEKKEYKKRFVDILKKNPEVAHDSRDGNRVYKYYLLKSNMDIFGDEFLLNATDDQKYIIDKIRFKLTDLTEHRLKTYLEKYPDVVPLIELTPQTLQFFTIDELANLSEKDAKLYECAFRKEVPNRIKHILSLDPNFFCEADLIDPDILDFIDDEDLLNLTSIGRKELIELSLSSHPKRPLPERKVNGIIFRDNRRKRKMQNQAEFARHR